MYKKNIVFFYLIILSCSLFAQTKTKSTADPYVFLNGKTFVVSVYSFDSEKNTNSSTYDEIVFVNGKFYSKNMGETYSYKPDKYTCKANQNSDTISFVAFSHNQTDGIEIFWQGTIIGNQIKGTKHWFSKGSTNMFSGFLKYEEAAK